jgi:hypothetical protein
MKPFSNAEVAAKFSAYPPAVRSKLIALRELIFQAASTIDGAGEIEETLKWGEPAYVTKNKSGSTVRIDWKKKEPNRYAMYFNCQTNLIETFRTVFSNDFKFEGNRALVFELEDKLPIDAVTMCVVASFTYHLNKRKPRGTK